jgi:putative membrane protein
MTALAHGWYGYGPHMGFGFWGWLYPLPDLVARALAPRREDRALEILRERYARGEIDKETFRELS